MRRILFVGANSIFSAAHLAALNRAHAVVAVVETVAPLGRLKRLERRLVPSRLARQASEQRVPLHEVAHADHAALLRKLNETSPDLIVLAGIGWLLDAAALAVPRLGTLNVHPAPLPSYRGPEPYFWQLYDGAAECGVTVHLVDPREDHGPIVRQRRVPLPPGVTLAEFLARIIEIGPHLLVEAVDCVLRDTTKPIVQPQASPSRRARRLRPTDRDLIHWGAWDLDRTRRVLRGVGPILAWPPVRWRDLGWIPVIDDSTPGPCALVPGRIGRDVDGWFLSHPAGHIRFRYRWAPRAWLLAARRGAVPASGMIAAEKAAWPRLEDVEVHGLRD